MDVHREVDEVGCCAGPVILVRARGVHAPSGGMCLVVVSLSLPFPLAMFHIIVAMLSTDVAVTFNLHLLRVPVISPSWQTCSRSVAAGGGAAAGIVLLTSAMERASAAAEPIRAGTHHRLINGYSPAKRKHALETKSKLPEAVRVPPHRMLWRFILNCMADAHESAVVEFIEDNKDLVLKGEKEYIVAMMSKETPDHNHRKHCQQIIHEVMQLPGGSYGVAQLLRRISRASKTPDGREDLEARCITSPATLALPAAHALLLLLAQRVSRRGQPGLVLDLASPARAHRRHQRRQPAAANARTL